jgi:hypothetical protein
MSPWMAAASLKEPSVDSGMPTVWQRDDLRHPSILRFVLQQLPAYTDIACFVRCVDFRAWSAGSLKASKKPRILT